MICMIYVCVKYTDLLTPHCFLSLYTLRMISRLEMRTNPFARAIQLDAQIKAGLGQAAEVISDPIALLAAVREAKNNFK